MAPGMLALHIAAYACVYFFLTGCGFIPRIDVTSFIKFDAGWYASIVQHGYYFKNAADSNCSFFPVLPLIWRLTIIVTGSVWTVCLYNLLAFVSGLFILRYTFRFPWAVFLLVLSLPSNLFMFLPYTEATFFLFSSFLVAGLHLKNKYLIVTALFLSSLTRPVGMFYIPIVIFTEVLMYRGLRDFLRNTALYAGASALGLFTVYLYQYASTGVWLAFFKTQDRLFYHKFDWPHFPLNTWDAPRILWLDGFAASFAIAAIIALLIISYRRYLRRGREFIVPGQAELFSMCYLAATFLYLIFFNGVDVIGGTSLGSGNRYIAATAFFAVFLQYSMRQLAYDRAFRYAFIALIASTFVLFHTFGGGFSKYSEAEKFGYRLLLALNIGQYALVGRRFGRFMFPVTYVVNIALQIIFLQQFSEGKWVG